MNRLPVFWCQAPDEEDDEDLHTLGFRLREDWLAVDADQLVLPITVIERDYEEVEPVPGLLKQYGGESMLNDLLLDDQELEPGSTWRVLHGHNRRTIEPLDD